MRKILNKSIRSGTTTSASANKLVCTSGGFLTEAWPVRLGDKAIREVDDGTNLEATVTGLDSDAQLTVSSDIFSASDQAFRILMGDVYITGTTTSSSSKKLVDSGKTFVSSGVRPGMLAVNTDTDRHAWIESVSETELTLSRNIFGSSSPYLVYAGETFFEREYEELRVRKFLIAGDDTETTTVSTTDEELKELICASSNDGYLLTGLRFVYDCKIVGGGTLTITTKINGSSAGTNTTISSSYEVKTLSLTQAYADGTILDIKIYGKVTSGTGYLRLTEIYAIV